MGRPMNPAKLDKFDRVLVSRKGIGRTRAVEAFYRGLDADRHRFTTLAGLDVYLDQTEIGILERTNP